MLSAFSFGVLVSSDNTVHLVRFLRTTSNMEVQDHYEVLGITREATTLQIKAARTKLLQNHPDKANVYDAEKYRSVQLAFDVLSSAKARRQYDRLLNRGTVSRTMVADRRFKCITRFGKYAQEQQCVCGFIGAVIFTGPSLARELGGESKAPRLE